jgi:elongation factor Ts
MPSHSHKGQELLSSSAVTSYIHAGGKIGVLVEFGCESDFVARTDDFKKLIHDIAMHIAASGPKFIRKEHVSPQIVERQRAIYRTQAAADGKPPQVIERIVEGRMSKFYEEVCLYDQPFIKDQAISISQLIASRASNLGENIAIRRFVRFKVGDSNTIADDSDQHPEGGDETGATANKPKSPIAGSGFTAATLDVESE